MRGGGNKKHDCNYETISDTIKQDYYKLIL
uniref:Uncharacterized protein n=1 Tax=Heterorhabditis bacteriophora TaxID=37862 RepID=A0A1I7WJN9_HETBA